LVKVQHEAVARASGAIATPTPRIILSFHHAARVAFANPVVASFAIACVKAALRAAVGAAVTIVVPPAVKCSSNRRIIVIDIVLIIA
jgi:hypothetical protein